jgi:hypothetical protein
MLRSTTSSRPWAAIRLGSALGFALSLGACATMPVATSQTDGGARGAGPRDVVRDVVMERDFSGRTYARGVFTNGLTGAKRPFSVVLDGRWNGRVLTLREAFAYDDGERDVKTWQLTRTGPGTYTGTREDVVGQAHVYTEGNAVRLGYDIDLPTSSGAVRLRFEDVIERRGDGAIVNRAIVSKFGLPIGDVDLVFGRRPIR